MVAQLRGGYTHGRPLLLAGQHALKTELQRILRLVKQLSLTRTVASPTHAMTSTNTPLDAIHIGRYQVLPRTDRIQDVDTRTVHRYTCARTIYIIDSGGDMSGILATMAKYDKGVYKLSEEIRRLEQAEQENIARIRRLEQENIARSYTLLKEIRRQGGFRPQAYYKTEDKTIRGTIQRLKDMVDALKAAQNRDLIKSEEAAQGNSLRTPAMPVSLRTGDRKWTY
jgi:hypothetical protein